MNVEQMLNNYMSLRLDGEWSSEIKIVFNFNKAVMQMEMIELQ